MPLLSPIQYSGGRSQKIDDILTVILEKRQGEKIPCFYELFAGAASLSLNAIEADIAHSYVINDAYWGFALFWHMVRDAPEQLIANYQQLVGLYTQTDETSRHQFYQWIQVKFNEHYLHEKHPSQDLKVLQAARFAFIINHAHFGEPFFKEFYPNKSDKKYQFLNCQMTSELGQLEIDEAFSSRVLAIHQLLQNKNVHFESKSFFDYIDTVSSKSLLVLDPPYPNCPDQREAPSNYLYYRTDTKQEMQTKLQEFVKHCIRADADFLLFYEVLGLKSHYPLILNHTLPCLHWGEHPPYGHYVENLYVSEGYFEAITQSQTMLPFDNCLRTTIEEVNDNPQVSEFEKYKSIAVLVKLSLDNKTTQLSGILPSRHRANLISG